ncbi:basic helix-loop-helix protein A-like [Vigna unguiculata]|nr:basic helix-loop-helix protein A-like [Vigna unguiculata]
MQGRITKKETETHSTMPPLSQIPPSSSSSFPHPSSIAEATANTTTTRKRVKRMVHSHCGSINMERERRSKMTQMFTQLQTSVPGLLPQATREVIVNETIGYIKELEKKKQRLEELKKLKETVKGVEGSTVECGNNNRDCSIVVTVSANVAFFGIQWVPRPGLVAQIFKVFCNHQAEILAANVTVNNGKLILAITASVQNNGNCVVEKIKREIMGL